jgi:hypothetical protein
MAGNPSSRHDILKVARQLQQQPQGDPAAVQRMAKKVQAAVTDALSSSWETLRQRDHQHQDISSCALAVLQCAGWLLQAMITTPSLATIRVQTVADMCLAVAARWMGVCRVGGQRYQMDDELVQALLRPAAGGRPPGTWQRV